MSSPRREPEAGREGREVRAGGRPVPFSPARLGRFGQKRKRGFSKVKEEPERAGLTRKEQTQPDVSGQGSPGKQQPPRINCVCARSAAGGTGGHLPQPPPPGGLVGLPRGTFGCPDVEVAGSPGPGARKAECWLTWEGVRLGLPGARAAAAASLMGSIDRMADWTLTSSQGSA